MLGLGGAAALAVSTPPPHALGFMEPYTVKIHPYSKCSGYGQVADNYYHFLIDFSVRVFNECNLGEPTNECDIYIQQCEGMWVEPENARLETGNCSTWNHHVSDQQLSTFHPVSGSMGRLFNHTFAGRVREHHVPLEEVVAIEAPELSFRHFDSIPADFEHGTCSGGNSLSFVPEGECDEWSRQPPQYFARFREAVLDGTIAGGKWERAGLTGVALEAVRNPGILVIERTTATTERLDAGRSLSPALRSNLSAWAETEAVPLHFVEPNSNMSVRDQARLFNSAKIVVANHGAACSNVMFCAPGTHFVELPEVLYPCYSNLAERAGLVYHASPQEEALALVQCLWWAQAAGHGEATACGDFATPVAAQ